MSDDGWLIRYAQLVMDIDAIFRESIDERFLESSYGFEGLRPANHPPATLLAHASRLADDLGAQGFAPARQQFLAKQMVALETVCRRLAGETFPLYDEVQRCFDVTAGWIDESVFDQALMVYDEALPGAGSVAERLALWRRRHEGGQSDPSRQSQALDLMLGEIRRRTSQWVELPAEETVEVGFFDDRSHSGEALYQGGYRSKIGLHVLLLRNLNLFLETLSHESYLGHHVECCLKEKLLYHKQGFIEQGLWVRFTPQTFVSEALAQSAMPLLFAGNEAETWLADHICPLLQVAPPLTESHRLLQARDTLEGAWCNAAALLRDGASDADIAAYLTRYTLPPDVDFLKTPFLDTVMFSYVFSKRLMPPILASAEAPGYVTRLLTEQVLPGTLAAWGASESAGGSQ